MSGQVENHEPRTAANGEELPPVYDSSQPTSNSLISIIENEQTLRSCIERLEDLSIRSQDLVGRPSIAEDLTSRTNALETARILREIMRKMNDVQLLCAELVGVCERRANHNPELYAAMAKLSPNELEQTFNSLQRDMNRQRQHRINQNREDVSVARFDDATSSGDRSSTISAEVEDANTVPDRSLQSIYTIGVQKLKDHGRGMTPRNLWKRISILSSRP